MASPPTAVIMVPQWTANQIVQPVSVAPANIQQSYQVLNKGQPKALGATQLVLAFLQIAMGTVLFFTTPYNLPVSSSVGIHFWGAVFYIISGSLSVAVENKPSHSLIQGFLAMNIISSLVSFISVCLFISDACIYYYCYGSYEKCDYENVLYSNKIAVLSFLIIASLLQFCVCVSLSAFGCKSLSHTSTAPAQVFVIQNDARFHGPNFIPTVGNQYEAPPGYTNMTNTGLGIPVDLGHTPVTTKH
ncbi:membrane-spanning 4-domains subfamily A member 4A-like [Pelobates cultripes]|uniref:Membrane-spanning 4-domains subfamily A member 4A-like n=1 Tax=Pelobates cultripes TaxID=61616 RepID=A0AAD1WNN1_PELCU|nr:membrane-spanning 4-domains subfamily A member 4A-like [Pelobates cultripes]